METVEGIHYKTGEKVTLRLDGERIKEVRTAPANGSSLPQIAPGLVELQINGFGGLDWNKLPIPDDLMSKATRLLWGEGITTFFPTVVTNSDEAIEQEVRSIAAACRKDGGVGQTVGGIHVEGPFICPQDGARGAHNKNFVKAPDWALFQRWQEAAEGRIKIITLSPEWPGSADFIAKCAASGVTASIGHTGATPAQVREAVAAGARMSTHLGNGSHLTLPRHQNYLWEQMAQDSLWAGVIADGFHLPEAPLKVILRVKGPKAFLVSDAVDLAGMEPGVYEKHVGGKVVLTPEGKLHLHDNPNILSGSAQILKHCVGQVARLGLMSLGEAWDMASTRPAGIMGLAPQKGLAEGAPADVVLFDWKDSAVRIRKVFKAGRPVFDRPT